MSIDPEAAGCDNEVEVKGKMFAILSTIDKHNWTVYFDKRAYLVTAHAVGKAVRKDGTDVFVTSPLLVRDIDSEVNAELQAALFLQEFCLQTPQKIYDDEAKRILDSSH